MSNHYDEEELMFISWPAAIGIVLAMAALVGVIGVVAEALLGLIQ
jgi:hypothetical protein